MYFMNKTSNNQKEQALENYLAWFKRKWIHFRGNNPFLKSSKSNFSPYTVDTFLGANSFPLS